MNYEKAIKNYVFLTEIKSKYKEHIEVSEEAVRIYHEYYDVYKKEWLFNEYADKRNQMTTSGAWMSKENKNSINIAGDILTAKSAFNLVKNKDEEITKLYNLFVRIYHTPGNCIPWCEGSNKGGGNYKEKSGYFGSSDFFTNKLIRCKKIFDNKKIIEDNDQQIKQVEFRIENGFPLGNIRANIMNEYNKSKRNEIKLEPLIDDATLKYWIVKEWKNNSWERFVKEHYLIDMVDENYEPIPFVVSVDNENSNRRTPERSDMIIKASLTQSIKLIALRGYRIHYNIKERFNDENEKHTAKILSNLGI